MKTKEKDYLSKTENQIRVYNKTPRDEIFPSSLPKECYQCAATDEYLAYIRFLQGLTKGKLDNWWIDNLSLRKLCKMDRTVSATKSSITPCGVYGFRIVRIVVPSVSIKLNFDDHRS